MHEGPSPRPSAWQRWRALPAPERRVVPALFFLLPAVAAGIRVFGVGRVCRVLGGHAAPAIAPDAGAAAGAAAAAAPDAIAIARARRLGGLVAAAARRLPGHPACLTRSVTLWYLLRRRGLPATLRLGVRTADAQLEAHAWVELGGQVVNDAADVGQHFAAFEKLDLDSRVH